MKDPLDTTLGATRGGRKAERRRIYRHQLGTMKRAIAKLGARAIPGNSKLGYALKAWRRELIQDLGGEDNVSIQQRTIVELASTTRLMISSLDAWITSQGSLMRRDKTLLPVVLQRQQLADSLARMLGQLGLKRVEKKPVDWRSVLRGEEPVNDETAQATENGNGNDAAD